MAGTSRPAPSIHTSRGSGLSSGRPAPGSRRCAATAIGSAPPASNPRNDRPPRRREDLRHGRTPLRIRRRLTLLFVLVAALSTLTAGLVLDRAIDRNVTGQIGETLRRDAGLARDLARAEADLPRTADALADRLGRDLGIRVTVIAADGTVLGDTDLDGEALARVENHAGRPEVIAALRDGEGRSIRYSTTVSDRLLYLALRIDPSEPGRGILRVAVPLTAVRQARQEIRTQLLKAAIVSVLAAAIFGWLLALRPSRRLEEMSRTAGEIASGRLGVRARAPRGDDEIGALARSMNRMADQLEERLALLARERNQLQTVLDGMVEGVLLTGPDGTILLANAAFERI